MGMPARWAQRRYGMAVANSLASVPAWAPRGHDPLWYRCHLGAVAGGGSSPLVEVLAHHRDRWDHVADYDDFSRLVAFDDDAPEIWARLAAEAGMALSLSTAKHHDGWCWWDAPATTRVVGGTQGSTVCGEHAAACERHGLTFGAVYSTLDWADPEAGSVAHAETVITPQLAHLATHERPQVMWLRGTPAAPDPDPLLQAIDAAGSDLTVFSDFPLPGAVEVFSHMPPAIRDSPWILNRGIGAGHGYNRAESAGDLLDATAVIALYTETLAKGGALLVSVGTDAAGRVPDEHAAPLRAAGRWIRSHAAILDTAAPWTVWGDAATRLLADPDDASTLWAVDLSGAGRFAALTPDRAVVHGAAPALPGDDPPPRVEQDGRGLVVDSGHSAGPVVWRLTIGPSHRPAELFPTTHDEPIDISELLTNAAPGEIVQLGEGVHCGRVSIPDRVTLRGLGPGRTTVHVADDPVELGRGSRLEHVSVAPRSPADPASTLVALVGERGRVLGCSVAGRVEIRADDAAVRGSQLHGVQTKGADRFSLSHCELDGGPGEVAIRLGGGGEHLVDSCEVRGHDSGVLATDTTGTKVRGCTISARRVGVRLSHTEDARVRGNQFHRNSRAVDVEAGTQARVEGNAVFDGDSGCVVRLGAADTHVSGNHWERCRVGLLTWDSAVTAAHDNTAIDLLDPDGATVSGP